MNTRMLLSFGLSALVLGGTMVGCSANSGGLASAGTRDAALSARTQSDRANAALARHDGAQAIRFAEATVGLMPQNASYRALLGRSYVAGGRFASARAAFADAMTLEPNDGKTALNLALAQTATGDWAAARQTLTTYAAIIPASDRGLALALSGDPAGAVGILTQVARSPDANAKVRQNLALSLALAGQWQAARLVASADMSPADVDARLQQWAAFAQPQSASQQVASLLGVRPAVDPGQPVALALNAPVAVDPARFVEAPAPAPDAAPVTVAATLAPAPAHGGVVFGERREVVQALPAPLLRAPADPVRRVLASQAVPDKVAAPRGEWVVQIGAFRNAAVAKAGWVRATRRLPALGRVQPTGMRFADAGGDYYRVSVGGFDRAAADSICQRYRAKGGACFVRHTAGDHMAQWLASGAVQLAAR